jgi:tetratricopeptide (TPR) repeat protein
MWRCRVVFVGWLWFIGILLPVSGLLQNGGQLVAFRYTYISYIGLLLFGLCVVRDLFVSRQLFNVKWALACGGAMGIGLLSATAIQQEHWKDDIAVWDYALLSTRENHLAMSNLSNALRKRGHSRESLEKARVAVKLDPSNTAARFNLAFGLYYKGLYHEAESEFRKLDGVIAGWLKERGIAREVPGSGNHSLHAREISHDLDSVRDDGETAEIVLVRSLSSHGAGNPQEALSFFHMAEVLSPEMAYSIEALPIGFAAELVGDDKEALRINAALMDRHPSFPLAFERAALLAALSHDTDVRNSEEARRLSMKSLELAPQSLSALLVRALVLETLDGEGVGLAFLREAGREHPEAIQTRAEQLWRAYLDKRLDLVTMLRTGLSSRR